MRTTERTVLFVFLAAVVVGVGCSDDDRHEAIELDGDIYTEKFSCNQTFTGQPVTCADNNEVDQIQFDRTGFNTYEVRVVPDTGFVRTGSVSGHVFSWSGSSPNGYTETGTWTFSGDGSFFSGPSHYVANNATYSGDCNTNGSSGFSTPPDPPAPIGCP